MYIHRSKDWSSNLSLCKVMHLGCPGLILYRIPPITKISGFNTSIAISLMDVNLSLGYSVVYYIIIIVSYNRQTEHVKAYFVTETINSFSIDSSSLITSILKLVLSYGNPITILYSPISHQRYGSEYLIIQYIIIT